MSAFKNRNGNHSPAVHNQADLGQRRRGRASAPQQMSQGLAAQAPAEASQAPTTTQPAVEAPSGSRRRRQQAAPVAPNTTATAPLQTVPVASVATEDSAQPTPLPAPGSRRRQQMNRQPPPQTGHTTVTPAAQPVTTQASAISASEQAQLQEERKERRQIRVAAPNMTWKALADVPKPDGPLNSQMLQVARLIEVGIELAAMVEDENLQMAQGQVRMLSDHQAHKSELSSAYIQTMNNLRAHPPALKEDNMPMIQFMKEVAARVQTALDTHMSMCRAAMSMTEQLIGKIRKDVAAHDGQELQYKNPLLDGRARRATQERVSAVAHNSLV